MLPSDPVSYLQSRYFLCLLDLLCLLCRPCGRFLSRHPQSRDSETGKFVIRLLRRPLIAGLTLLAVGSNAYSQTSAVEVTAFRFRSSFEAGLNVDAGWAAAENAPAQLWYDQPFRLRLQVSSDNTGVAGQLLSLQYRVNSGSWQALGYSDFPYPRFATPVMSAVSTSAYEHGDDTERLLGSAESDWDEGIGLNGVANTPVWRGAGDAMEWEWPLVVRRFSDGPTFSEDNSEFELRVVDEQARPIPAVAPIRFSARSPVGHLGGTFVETPGRLGPYQNDQGHLYFIMEPTETDNRFMMMRSTDHGRSWREVDGANRPRADDLEGVASVRLGNTIHMIHQVTREVFHHGFEMEADDGRWIIDSESIAAPGVPATQYADVVALSDGSLMAFYSGERKLFLQRRSPDGEWEQPREIDSSLEPELSGPVLVAGRDDSITLAYTGRDGRGFVRRRLADGSLSPRLTLSNDLGTEDPQNGAILPLVAMDAGENGSETVIVYREQNGLLFERRLSAAGQLSNAMLISPIPVVTDAVDSEQAGADLLRFGNELHLLFIDQATRSIYHTQAASRGGWVKPRKILDGIEASWLRGSIHEDKEGNPVYGFVYDAGSKGGAGANFYHSFPP